MKVSTLMSKIIDLATDRLKLDPNNYYVSITTYDCGGSWQVWLNVGKSGIHPNNEVIFSIFPFTYVEQDTLINALKTMLDRLKNKEINVKLRQVK